VSTAINRAKPIVIPAGRSATLTNATMSACDRLTCGYQLNAGPLVTVGSRSTNNCGPPETLPDVTVGPFADATVLRV
jgi:hypothetical protein